MPTMSDLRVDTLRSQTQPPPDAAAHCDVSDKSDGEGACMGAACGVVVKLEEQAALDEYDARAPAKSGS